MKHSHSFYSNTITFDFHPSRKARDTFGLDDALFTLRGNVIMGDMRTAQLVAAKLNEAPRKKPISPAELYALGILHEVFHFIIESYRKTQNPEVFAKCENALQGKFAPSEINSFLAKFSDLFPPLSVYNNKESLNHYLAGQVEGMPNRHAAMQELMLIWIENQNPALKPFIELIGDHDLKSTKHYAGVTTSVDHFFDTQPPFANEKEPLVKMLLKPIKKSPNSIMGQLEFIRVHWEKYLAGHPLFRQLLLATDFIREESKYFAMLAAAEADKKKMPRVTQTPFFGWGDKESQPVTTYTGYLYENEQERFSQDLNWMPRLVLIAKTTYVWLDQLSKKYQRPITRLDHIPDEELDALARWGFTGLWLIGIWERSYASKRIKHLHGNIDAVASAYSLNDYIIASDIGGDEGYRNLRDRAAHRGIKLASDMVPNHMGIDSRWMIQHPDWFLTCDYLPYPNYRFDGPDLSSDNRVGIFLEDGYWRKSDAAVVFKRLDRWSGDVRYIYHGNDGTSTPWNDTAQLNFLKAEVREGVIQTILHVARQFPIIRFDAAMVLAKKHIQRLWFPEPGHGGAIPSRAAFAMTKEQLDALMPVEFWREVVDRVQQEAPDTLLLAEAFWMMEGYFVRTLGMHRVYNSAFMNMLKKEENLNYRMTIKNVLEYNPQILKRHVNFMNNPDEETAVAQFGRDDKYFGVCAMMCTMPGLPMFGHGQIEGFTEKYGMEYRRAYYDEQPDHNLMLRHEREIFPLLKKRYLFSDVENFILYDVYNDHGGVNEDVFAYSNRHSDERGLVIYNNRFSHAVGWIKTSAGFLHNGDVVQRTLAEGLNLSHDHNTYCIFRDAISGLEYIHLNRSIIEEGLFVDLHAFKYHVFLDFREVKSSFEKPYDVLARTLGGRGVHSIEEEVMNLRYQAIHRAFQDLVAPEQMQLYFSALDPAKTPDAVKTVLKEKIGLLLNAVDSIEGANKEGDKAIGLLLEEFSSFVPFTSTFSKEHAKAEDWQAMLSGVFAGTNGWRVLIMWNICHRLHTLLGKMNDHNRDLVREWRLGRFITHSLKSLDADIWMSVREEELIHLLSLREIDDGLAMEDSFSEAVSSSVRFPAVRAFIGVNLYEGVEYFNKEKMEELLQWLFIIRTVYLVNAEAARMKKIPNAVLAAAISTLYKEYEKITEAFEACGYDINRLGSLLLEPAGKKNGSPSSKDKIVKMPNHHK
jgi:glycosidase